MILQKKNIHMVKVYDNIIPDDVCQKLIGIFETNVQHQHFINENNLPFAEGNAIKYICRHKNKGKKKDIEKAIHYLEMIIERDYSA